MKSFRLPTSWHSGVGVQTARDIAKSSIMLWKVVRETEIYVIGLTIHKISHTYEWNSGKFQHLRRANNRQTERDFLKTFFPPSHICWEKFKLECYPFLVQWGVNRMFYRRVLLLCFFADFNKFVNGFRLLLTQKEIKLTSKLKNYFT